MKRETISDSLDLSQIIKLISISYEDNQNFTAILYTWFSIVYT